jgi:hypothetical protein
MGSLEEVVGGREAAESVVAKQAQAIEDIEVPTNAMCEAEYARGE